MIYDHPLLGYKHRNVRITSYAINFTWRCPTFFALCRSSGTRQRSMFFFPPGNKRYNFVENGNRLASRFALLILYALAQGCRFILEQPSGYAAYTHAFEGSQINSLSRKQGSGAVPTVKIGWQAHRKGIYATPMTGGYRNSHRLQVTCPRIARIQRGSDHQTSTEGRCFSGLD